MIEEDAAEAQAWLAEFVRAERQMEEAVVAAKFCHLHEVARGDHSTDPKKVKRKGKAADRKDRRPRRRLAPEEVLIRPGGESEPIVR